MLGSYYNNILINTFIEGYSLMGKYFKAQFALNVDTSTRPALIANTSCGVKPDL